MPTDSLLITGASGFIGNRLLYRIEPEEFRHIYCLSRTPPPAMGQLPDRKNITYIPADLRSDNIEDVLGKVDTVIHLAALTGKAPRRDYIDINTIATQRLLEQCRQQNVENFLFVSTIAVKFRSIRRYFYAQSKKEAEAAVQQSGLSFAMVRPTIVIGPGGAIWDNLCKLATAPIAVVFGSGKNKVQPIFVDDLVDCLRKIAREKKFDNCEIELGGPEIISWDRFIRKIRQVHGKGTSPVLHLPYTLTKGCISLMERVVGRFLPVSAGQLTVFGEDSTIRTNQLFAGCSPAMKSVDEMLQIMIGAADYDTNH